MARMALRTFTDAKVGNNGYQVVTSASRDGRCGVYDLNYSVSNEGKYSNKRKDRRRYPMNRKRAITNVLRRVNKLFELRKLFKLG